MADENVTQFPGKGEQKIQLRIMLDDVAEKLPKLCVVIGHLDNDEIKVWANTKDADVILAALTRAVVTWSRYFNAPPEGPGSRQDTSVGFPRRSSDPSDSSVVPVRGAPGSSQRFASSAEGKEQ